MTDSTETTFYDEIGGMPVIERIVRRFYAGVATDDVLGPMYPPEDLADGSAAERLTLFLAQYWGGPTTYSERRATRACACVTRPSRSRPRRRPTG